MTETLLEMLGEGEIEEHEGIVGSGTITLSPGDRWVFDRDAVYYMEGIDRRAIVRMPCVRARDDKKTRYEIFKERLRAIGTRYITGECLLLDEHFVESGRASGQIKVTSKEIGGNLEQLRLERPWLIRKTTFFGAERNVDLEAYSPLSKLSRKKSARENWNALLQTMYGPSWILQRLVPKSSGNNRVYLQIDGDLERKKLEEGEEIKVNPMALWAWEEGTRVELASFGNWSERLISGSPPYITKVTGPGEVIISNQMYNNGYLGYVCTPWRIGHTLIGGLRNAFKKVWIFGE